MLAVLAKILGLTKQASIPCHSRASEKEHLRTVLDQTACSSSEIHEQFPRADWMRCHQSQLPGLSRTLLANWLYLVV